MGWATNYIPVAHHTETPWCSCRTETETVLWKQDVSNVITGACHISRVFVGLLKIPRNSRSSTRASSTGLRFISFAGCEVSGPDLFFVVESLVGILYEPKNIAHRTLLRPDRPACRMYIAAHLYQNSQFGARIAQQAILRLPAGSSQAHPYHHTTNAAGTDLPTQSQG